MYRVLVVIVALGLWSAPARAEIGKTYDPVTMGAQTLGGGIATVGVTALVAWALYDEDCRGWDCLDFSPIITGVLAGLTADIAAVQLIGDGLDGTGKLGGTLAGTAIGVGGSIAITAIMAKLDLDPPAPVIITTLVLPLVAGGVLGYHISGDDDEVTSVPLMSLAF
jgi:hypothetical protein